MEYDYDKIGSLSEAEFERLGKSIPDQETTKSDVNDIRRIEEILDLREGILENEELYLGKADCGFCGRRLTFYDFVATSIYDAGHPKSFVVHTILGRKFIRQPIRPIRCSSCGTVYASPLAGGGGPIYSNKRYGCCQPLK